MSSFAFDKPQTDFPSGSWDCHVHVFGDPARFRFAPDRRYTPMGAEVADLKQHLAAIGADRAVIVQASPYGDDNSCLLDALAQMEGRAAGVVTLGKRDLRDDASLADLEARNVRGARLQLRYVSEEDAEAAVTELGRALAGTCWHIEINLRRTQMPLVAAAVETHSLRFVLDHFADIRAFGAEGGEPGMALQRVMQSGRVWLKLSAAHRAPGLDDPSRLVQMLATAFPDRCIWGSDWPHTPGHGEGSDRLHPRPFRSISNAQTIDPLLGTLDASLRSRILTTTPLAFYSPHIIQAAG